MRLLPVKETAFFETAFFGKEKYTRGTEEYMLKLLAISHGAKWGGRTKICLEVGIYAKHVFIDTIAWVNGKVYTYATTLEDQEYPPKIPSHHDKQQNDLPIYFYLETHMPKKPSLWPTVNS